MLSPVWYDSGGGCCCYWCSVEEGLKLIFLQMPFPQHFVQEQDETMTVILACPGAVEGDWTLKLSKSRRLLVKVKPSVTIDWLTELPPHGVASNQLGSSTYNKEVDLPFEVESRCISKDYQAGMMKAVFARRHEVDCVEVV